MNEDQINIQRLSPEKLLDGFRKRPLMPILVIAMVVHLVILFATTPIKHYKQFLFGIPPAEVKVDDAKKDDEKKGGVQAVGADAKKIEKPEKNADASTGKLHDGKAIDKTGMGSEVKTGSREVDSMLNEKKDAADAKPDIEALDSKLTK